MSNEEQMAIEKQLRNNSETLPETGLESVLLLALPSGQLTELHRETWGKAWPWV
jgi:hypothetical protein